MRNHLPFIAAVAFLVGCFAPPEARPPSPTTSRVPAQAPDRIPERFFDPNNLRGGMACVTGPAQRGIVVVRFEEDSTQAERQEAVDQVGGEVVGGLASDTREGFYFVAVEDDPDGEIVCAAAATLNAMPQVSIATLSVPDYANRR